MGLDPERVSDATVHAFTEGVAQSILRSFALLLLLHHPDVHDAHGDPVWFPADWSVAFRAGAEPTSILKGQPEKGHL